MDLVLFGIYIYLLASINLTEALTFTTENFHGGKWIIKHGATDTLICRNKPYTGKMSLIYEKQRVAECSQNSCKTHFTDNGTFNIRFDIKNGEIQWKINPVTTKYDGKLFKCSDGTETLRLSPVVEALESLTFTTDNFHDGQWIIKNGAADTLICRSSPYTGKMSLIYETHQVAVCLLNSCKTYFTDYGNFKIKFDKKHGETQWKIDHVTTKYNGKLFKCCDGTETLKLSPFVFVEHVEGRAYHISDSAMLLYAFILGLAIFIYARLFTDGFHEDLNIQKGFELLKKIARNTGTELRNRWSTKVVLDYLFDSVIRIAWVIAASVVGIALLNFMTSFQKFFPGRAYYISDSAMLLYAFILGLAIFIYARLFTEGFHEDLNIQKGFELLKKIARNTATELRNRWSTKVVLYYLFDSVIGIAWVIAASVVGIARQIVDGIVGIVLFLVEAISFILKTVSKGYLSVKSARSKPNRGLKIITSDLTFEKLIFKGQFGEVWKGGWYRSGQDTVVALKTFKTGGKDQAESNIEVELMQWMDHENVIQFYGSCINNITITIVMEFMENGNLLQYLQDERGNLGTSAYVHIASQIAKGMVYVESLMIIHRDLAARNILVGSFSSEKTVRNVKIADFGCARRLANENSEYIPMQGEPFPFNRWNAPEVLENYIFTFKSDVWSFGILLMEMVTIGRHPYPGMIYEDIYPHLKQSPENRIKCSKYCPPELFKIIQMCWKLDRAMRPTFQEIKEKLDKF